MKATVVIEGTPEEVAEALRLLHGLGELELSFGPEVQPLPPRWDAHPALARLTAVEREIVRLDLLYEPRRRIAQALELTVGTVTVYRRSIRAKLRAASADEYPAAIQRWLRRFPGQRPTPSSAEPPPKPPATPL